MGELVELLIYLATEFANYLLAYVIFFQAKITRKKKRWFCGIAIILAIHLSVLFSLGSYDAQAISFMTMVVIPVFLLDTIEKKWFFLYPFVVMGTSCIMLSLSFIAAVLLKQPEYVLVRNNIFGLVFQSIPIIAMLMVYGYRKIRKYEPIQVQLGFQQYVLFYIGTLCTLFMLSPIQVLSKGNLSDRMINICGASVSIASVVFILVILWQGIVVFEKIKYQEQNKRYEEYMQVQSEYFQDIIARDEKMRSFRHDMDTHIQMLKRHCLDKNYQEMEKYLDGMIRESAIYAVPIYTGNKSVDAVMRTFVEKAEQAKIALTIEGRLPSHIHVSIYDCCTVLSNLMKNAIEACEKIENPLDRKIKVAVSSYNSQIYLRIQNTVKTDVIIRNNQLITSKKDKENHGIGSKNVENTVKKYNGEVNYRCEDGWFCVEVDI